MAVHLVRTTMRPDLVIEVETAERDELRGLGILHSEEETETVDDEPESNKPADADDEPAPAPRPTPRPTGGKP